MGNRDTLCNPVVFHAAVLPSFASGADQRASASDASRCAIDWPDRSPTTSRRMRHGPARSHHGELDGRQSWFFCPSLGPVGNRSIEHELSRFIPGLLEWENGIATVGVRPRTLIAGVTARKRPVAAV